jgi:2,4-dienoyl-CoA reductase-like NADH-dependent reductase (Old Yellow Enzyme family)
MSTPHHLPGLARLPDLAHVFRPVQVGTLSLDHRMVVPPHGGGNGNLLGSEAEFEQHCALWLAKADGGMQWLGGGPNFVRNPLPIGFEPTGVGSHGPGFFRDPRYPERIGEFARRLHAAGAFVSVQMVQQGGMPSAPSATFSGYADHRIAHALDLDEVRWLIREYGESAAIAIDAGVDAIEIHANHDDVVQWFLSPATNLRDDEYGGSFDNRRRFLREITETIRSLARRPFTFGLRLNLDENIEGGYDIDGCRQIVEAFTADGTLDYFSFDVGSNWDAPSYIPIPWYDDIAWAELCGQAKQATNLPVVYAGRVTSAEQAERVLAGGHADLVAMARATMADPAVVNKARGLVVEPVRPCIGLNECIHRKQVEGLAYACGVNPTFAREAELRGRATRTSRPRDVLVVGAGPGGSELAALCAEQGHTVHLWERNPHIGGALAVAALARGNAKYREWIDYQADRLDRLGVDLQLRREATVDEALAAGACTPQRPCCAVRPSSATASPCSQRTTARRRCRSRTTSLGSATRSRCSTSRRRPHRWWASTPSGACSPGSSTAGSRSCRWRGWSASTVACCSSRRRTATVAGRSTASTRWCSWPERSPTIGSTERSPPNTRPCTCSATRSRRAAWCSPPAKRSPSPRRCSDD